MVSLLFFIPIWYQFFTGFASPSQLGAIIAWTGLVMIVLELPTGALADLIGRKKTVFIGCLVEGASYLYLSQTRGVGWLWGGYLLSAVAGALISGAVDALNYDSLKELGQEKDYARFLSSTSLIFRIGFIAAILAGGYLYELSPRLPHFLTGLALLAGGLVTLGNTEPRLDSEKFSLSSYYRQTRLGVKELAKTEHTLLLSIYYFLVGGVSWFFMSFLSYPFTSSQGFSSRQMGWIFSLTYLVMTLASYLLVRWPALTRRRVYGGLPLVLVASLVPGYWSGRVVSLGLLFLGLLIGGLRFVLLDQYVNEEFSSKYRATALSTLNMGVGIIFAVLAVVGGRLIDVYGPGLVMTLLGITVAVVVLPVTRLLLVRYNSKLATLPSSS